jgi:transcriptional regulator with PAS, ATPase and Fis domain
MMVMDTQQDHIGIIGTSGQMLDAIERVRQVAPTDLSVLITGESGTGKEVFAQTLHDLSKRRLGRMVSINCGAIPETLLESELFGSEKGAYTGANEQRKGFFEAANNGTIFLDELGEMPIGTQVKLLRVLESGEFSRLGSADVLRTNVRVIAATNRRLEEEVAAGRFRRDLYYRLNAVQIEIPPLREHPEDIPALAAYFAQRTATKIGVQFEGISTDSMRLLMNLPWTGNVRELRNLIETVVTLEKGLFITLDMLRPYVPRALKSPETPFPMLSEVLPSIPQAAMENEVVTGAPQHVHSLVRPQARSSGRIGEAFERELLYKALVDLVREVSSLRGEITELKDIVYAQYKPNSMTDTVPDSVPNGMADHVPNVSTQSMQNFTALPYKTSLEGNGDGEAPTQPTSADGSQMNMHEMEKRLILTALERFGGNRRLAADALGISERTLYRKLHEYEAEQ